MIVVWVWECVCAPVLLRVRSQIFIFIHFRRCGVVQAANRSARVQQSGARRRYRQAQISDIMSSKHKLSSLSTNWKISNLRSVGAWKEKRHHGVTQSNVWIDDSFPTRCANLALRRLFVVVGAQRRTQSAATYLFHSVRGMKHQTSHQASPAHTSTSSKYEFYLNIFLSVDFIRRTSEDSGEQKIQQQKL